MRARYAVWLGALGWACASCGGNAPSGNAPLEDESAEAAPPEATTEPSAANGAGTEEAAQASDADAAALGRANDAFAVDLWQRIRRAQPGNAAVSVASITMALAMTWAGARGETASQMSEVLHLGSLEPDTVHTTAGQLLARWNDPEREAYRLAVANRLFGERTYDFEAPYLALTREVYRAPLEGVDFRSAHEAARARINGWVAERTEDRIDELLPPGSIDTQTRLVLVNAVYFLGQWATQFDPAATRPAPFRVSAERSVEVPTMHATLEAGYRQDDAAQVLELGYEGGDLSMILVLPRDEGGLAALEDGLTAERLAALQRGLTPRRVAVALPRFRVDPPAPLELSAVLQQLGMRLAFQAGSADFTGLADPPSRADRLHISKVFHQAFVEVDERGTEAAAATAVVMARGGGPPPVEPARFEADHPFLFLIRDRRAETILFLGRVTDPS